jgi:hypothetical protein
MCQPSAAIAMMVSGPTPACSTFAIAGSRKRSDWK